MKPRFTITYAMTQGLAQIERARGFLEAAQLSEKWVRQMSERALLLEAHHTTHIEGARLTLDQAELLLAGQPVPEADVDDVRELLNYRDAFNLVSEYLDSGAPITEGLVREVHRRLVVGVRGEQARPGEYRLAQNYIVNSLTREIILDLLAHDNQLNERQMEALSFLGIQSRMTIQDFERLCPSVARRTLQRDLKDLVAKGLIIEEGHGATDPKRFYRINVRLSLAGD